MMQAQEKEQTTQSLEQVIYTKPEITVYKEEELLNMIGVLGCYGL